MDKYLVEYNNIWNIIIRINTIIFYLWNKVNKFLYINYY